MTLIELYDRTPIDNIVGTLVLRPTRTVFFTADGTASQSAVRSYSSILSSHGVNTVLDVRQTDVSDIPSRVKSIVDAVADCEDECVIDITGGEDVALVAIGMAMAGDAAAKKNVRALRIDHEKRRASVFLVSREGLSLEREIDYSSDSAVYLTVRENIELHGGRYFSSAMKFGPSDAAVADIDGLWAICRRDPADWNYKTGRLATLSSRVSEDMPIYTLHKESLGDGRGQLESGFWDELVRLGYIKVDRKRSGRQVYVYTFKNEITRECLVKSGSVLEYITYKAAIGLKSGGKSLFDDAEVGVVMGWDSGNDASRNEIDCVLMRGCVPIFISCKNGDVKVDELYKLDTVADKFGSGCSLKVLVSSAYFDKNSKMYDGERASQNLRDRARDMGVHLINKVHLKTEKSLQKEICKLAKDLL